jgi:hypothetical protein
MQPQAIGLRLGGSWRTSLDRAWRSEAIRRRFESDCGFAPIAENEEHRRAQTWSGDVQEYHERFLVWATEHLGLAEQAPEDIRRKLLEER